jgi:hypothetical protein
LDGIGKKLKEIKRIRSTVERKINRRETSICGGTRRTSMRGKGKERKKIKMHCCL